jgi:hypothetical protein
MGVMSRQPLVALVALSLLAAACGTGGSGADSASSADVTPVSTVAGVGVLPDTVPANRQPLVMVPPPVNGDGTAADLLGENTTGNRVLIIGDSIMASTSSRYGGQMCDALVPLGWEVEVEAEPSRFIEFGNKVLDKVLVDNALPSDDWNAAVVFLGSNYRGDQDAYEMELRQILDRLAPRPTLLFTVTEYRPDYSEVNEVVRKLAAEYDNVTLLDWQAIAETPGVLSGDRLHPTEMGREVLAQAVAGALGPVSLGDGACLDSAFEDDSAINGGTGGGSSVGGSSRPSRPTVTTVPSSGSGGSGGSGSSGGGTETPSTTLPDSGGGGTPTTQPPPTTPQTTAAPTTAPQTTVPTTPAAPAPAVPAAPLDPPPGP